MNKVTGISIHEKARVYAFLKVVFSAEPSPELIKYLQAPEIVESLKSTGVCLDTGDFTQSQLPKLQEDYTQLFMGPGKHIALNESIYTEKTPQFWGKSTVKIKKLIEYAGLELDENWVRMPDHISVEFELMQKLLEAKEKTKDPQIAEQCTKAINNLYKEHIIKWVPQVCDQVIEHARTSFYKAIGTWTKLYIQFELEHS